MINITKVQLEQQEFLLQQLFAQEHEIKQRIVNEENKARIMRDLFENPLISQEIGEIILENNLEDKNGKS